MDRKFSYRMLFAALLVGLAFTLFKLRMPIRTAFSSEQLAASLQKNNWEIKPIGSSVASSLHPNIADNPVPPKDSSVSNLLKASIKRETFGSFRLKGISLDETVPILGSAIIKDLNTGESRIYLLNAVLPDSSQLVDIKNNHVTVQKGSIRKKIYFGNQDMDDGGKNIQTLESAFQGYKKISDNEYGLKPYKLFRGNAKSILDFTISIHEKEGNMDGIRISGIEHNSLAHDLGLRENDVLLRVNDEPFTSLSKCVQAFINVENSDELCVRILRENNVISLTFQLYWEGESSWTPMDVVNSKAVSSLFTSDFISHFF